MKRTKNIVSKKADAILTSDWHLSENTPICRTDPDYMGTQAEKLMFLQRLSEENNCPVLCAGDIFDKWRISPWMMYWSLKHLPNQMIAIAGNHDLPMHSLSMFEKSALHIIEKTFLHETPAKRTMIRNSESLEQDNLQVYGAFYGAPIPKPQNIQGKRNILLLHTMIWETQRPSWSTGQTAIELLDEYGKYYDLILTGDNHQQFVVKKNKCVLVNPGSLLRLTADQIDFQPRCFLYYTKTNSIKDVKIPIKSNFVQRDYLNKKRKRDEQIMAYIDKMKMGWEKSLSYKDNLRLFFDENKTPKGVRDVIWQQLEPKK